ncbi:transposase, IS30 family [Neisseria meningitidis NZ-05/33]|nr:transposase, IS30 family [Neisseria meningitidis NZ-05/33]
MPSRSALKTAALAGLPSGKLFATCLIKEFYRHIQMAKTLKAETYFYRPYHSWEKGLNENTNGLIRQYSPNKPFSETSAIGRYVGFKMS